MKKSTSSAKISILILFWILNLNVFAQKWSPSLMNPYDAIGVVGGFHYQNSFQNFELGVTRCATVHSLFKAQALSFELGKSNSTTVYGLMGSFWLNGVLSLGLATGYHFTSAKGRGAVLRPMIGFGLGGIQLAYGYNLIFLDENINFMRGSQLSLRINLGLFELQDEN